MNKTETIAMLENKVQDAYNHEELEADNGDEELANWWEGVAYGYEQAIDFIKNNLQEFKQETTE